MTDNLLELNGVSKSFADFKLNNISFTLPKGYIMGLTGPNEIKRIETQTININNVSAKNAVLLADALDVKVKDLLQA